MLYWSVRIPQFLHNSIQEQLNYSLLLLKSHVAYFHSYLHYFEHEEDLEVGFLLMFVGGILADDLGLILLHLLLVGT